MIAKYNLLTMNTFVQSLFVSNITGFSVKVNPTKKATFSFGFGFLFIKDRLFGLTSVK